MTRISKYRLTELVYDKLSILLFEVVAKKNSREDFNKIMIAKRVVIIFLLMKNINYHTICDVVKVSSATVSKFHFIMEKSDGIVPALKNLVRNDKIALFLQGFFNDLFPPGVRGVNWKAAWQSKFDYKRKKSEGI